MLFYLLLGLSLSLLSPPVSGTPGPGLNESEKQWSKLPYEPDLSVDPLTIDYGGSEIQNLKSLIQASRIGPLNFENTRADGTYGLSRNWMLDARDHWLKNFSWPDTQRKLNRHPHFRAAVPDPETQFTYSIHFMALFSERTDAIPLVMFHGWPGSFLEFVELFDLVMSRFTPATSPYHLIVPSLPGFTLSQPLPVESDFGPPDAARIMTRLIHGLGFGDGYVVQGGDLGATIAMTVAGTDEGCKACHVNFLPITIAPEGAETNLTAQESADLENGRAYIQNHFGYAAEQGTRSSTIAFVLGSNPVSLLAWVGDKLVSWTSRSTVPSVDTVLTHITLWFFTSSVSNTFWPYRALFPPGGPPAALPFVKKPFGYSQFHDDVFLAPRNWAAAVGDLIWFKRHETGGHFAAMERPQALWEDVVCFLDEAFPDVFSA